jgi:hypothetical protein
MLGLQDLGDSSGACHRSCTLSTGLYTDLVVVAVACGPRGYRPRISWHLSYRLIDEGDCRLFDKVLPARIHGTDVDTD